MGLIKRIEEFIINDNYIYISLPYRPNHKIVELVANTANLQECMEDNEYVNIDVYGTKIIFQCYPQIMEDIENKSNNYDRNILNCFLAASLTFKKEVHNYMFSINKLNLNQEIFNNLIEIEELVVTVNDDGIYIDYEIS
ncbi:MAG: hypothetical protein N3F09_02005 [Bacteroidia bacterium]|nr:hypothetical protein [Bacteroidia bacterium]